MGSKLNFNEYKIFNEEGNKYVYSIPDNKIFQIDDRIMCLLNQDGKNLEQAHKNLNDTFSKKELNGILDNMLKFGFIKDETNKCKSCNIHNDIISLTLLVCHECNLRCTYCYGESGSYNDTGFMNIETGKKAIDFLINNSKSNELTVCFFGGEPLLKFDLIKELVSYCKEKEKKSHKIIKFSMTTNGTLINSEIEDFIIKNKISVQISIDGDNEIHDSKRYYPDKSGTHDTILRKTKLLREKNLVDARATISDNFDLVYIYDYLRSIGFNKVALSPAFNLLSDEQYDMLADAYIDFYLNFEKRIKEGNYTEVFKNKMFIQKLRQIHGSKIRQFACGVGRSLYAIDIHGNIYPCQRFVGEKETAIGNVFSNDNGKLDFIQKINIFGNKTCSLCWIRNLCVGGCAYDNYMATGNFNSPNEPYCRYIKKIINQLIHIYLRLTDEEKQILFHNRQQSNLKTAN